MGRWVVDVSPPYPCVDEAVWEETASHMLPRAVGYARGVLDYFFERYLAEGAPKGLSLIDWTEKHYDRKALKQEFHSQWWANVLVDKILRRNPEVGAYNQTF